MSPSKGVTGGEVSRPVPNLNWAWRLPQQTLNEPNYTLAFSSTAANSHPAPLPVRLPDPGPEKGAWLVGQPQLVPAHVDFSFLVFKEKGPG